MIKIERIVENFPNCNFLLRTDGKMKKDELMKIIFACLSAT